MTDLIRQVLLEATQIELGDLPSESGIRVLDQYWRSVKPAERLPSRQHFDPLDIPTEILPWIFLLDVLHDDVELDYFYRLVGTGIVDFFGQDATGRRAREVFSKHDQVSVLATFNFTVSEATPTYWIAPLPHQRMGTVDLYRGIFPLADDGKTVDKLLCIAMPA